MAEANKPSNVDVADSQHEFDTIKHHVSFEPPAPKPGKEWRSYPELPTSQDLNPDLEDPHQVANANYLLPNTWHEPWVNKNTYLETHYRLQREEAITMLRYSIQKYKEDPTMMDDEQTCIYTRVYVRGYLMTRLGPMCQVQFSTARSGKKIRWTQTHRLTVGTLVAVSTARDGFKTICMPAIISDHRVRDGLDQSPPIIHFQWANLNDAVMDPNEELVMVETKYGYFEAVRHTMVGLQHVANTETPLDKYLVEADKSDLTAEYVRENPRMNVSSLVHHIPDSSSMTVEEVDAIMTEVCEPLQTYSVLDGFDKSLSKYTNLDNSQLKAVHRILTKELAIVQGPPGTGKTFTSVQALQILLQSQEKGSNVIVVAAQTNHAVDQILIQLINGGYKVVRLGGRTQNEVIKRYSMYNLRRRAAPSRTQRADRDFKTFESARKKNIGMLEKVIDDVFPADLIKPETLQSAGIITESQLESLLSEQAWAAAPSSSSDLPTGPMAEWLGNQLTQVKLPEEKEPEFEADEDNDSIDLDAEDYDLELDDCIVDEDANGGRIEGKLLPIRHLWTGANPQHHVEGDLVIRRELRKSNLWDIDTKHRGAVYQYWQKQLLSLHRQNFRHILADNARIAKNLKINRWYKDTKCIKAQQIQIIGCTTTGLCKYRGLLAAMRPRTMLIEEAAETREANIISALYGSLHQLILVGDHQQLAPHCDTPGLGEDPYFMRVSMFERLVGLEMPYTMLNMQRRMIPSLRQDHPVVTEGGARPSIPGMAVPSFFFHHTWSEALDENLSRYNVLEAEMIVYFIDYLLMNGVQASQITVLTFYRGQKKKVMTTFKTKVKHWPPFTNVFTVDSYQGEENDIILLSLVRSNGPNGPHKAGFLQDQNRGVVSISRARRGFYIFGNMLNLAYAGSSSWNMWGRVQRVFETQGRFGADSRLPITCQNHGKTTWKCHPEDWCPAQLSCGHACTRQCHWVKHEKLICPEPCERILPCNHRCQQVCGEACVCNCADFTGAYSHDEFLDDNSALQGGIDKSRTAPFITLDQRRMGAATGNRGNRRGGRGNRFSRGLRPGVGYRGGSSRAPIQTVGGVSSVRSDNEQGNNSWATFDARSDDKQKLKKAQAQADLTESAPRSNAANLAIQDTFRPVTVDVNGVRSIGEGTAAKTITVKGAPSAQKDNDLLNFDDAIYTATLTTQSLALDHDLMDAEPGNAGLAASLPQGRRAGFAAPHQPRPHGGVATTGSSPAVRQADTPEWELASLADTASVVEGDDKDSEADEAAPEHSNDKGQDGDAVSRRTGFEGQEDLIFF
ncbi:hypothetical protein F4804DRAFT_345048 [Jackrogersella minutella]|nr:hypothetical protein F4804DRAFT_345048 [Jackrogersella minutella]